MTNQLTANKSPIPRKLNQGMIDALSLAIAKGNYAITACQLCGISEDCFYHWLVLAKTDASDGLTSDESPYVRLTESLKTAEAEAEAEMVARVRAAANPGVKKKVIKTDSQGNVTEEIHETGGDWLAAATHLERRHPDRWGRKDRTRVDINEKKTVTITHVEVVLNQGADTPQVIEGESRELKEGKDA